MEHTEMMVVTCTPGETVRLRRGPSTREDAIAKIPNGETVLRAGDRLSITGAPNDLRKFFMEIGEYYPVIRAFHEAGVYQHMYTNGTLATRENLAALAEAGEQVPHFLLDVFGEVPGGSEDGGTGAALCPGSRYGGSHSGTAHPERGMGGHAFSL